MKSTAWDPWFCHTQKPQGDTFRAIDARSCVIELSRLLNQPHVAGNEAVHRSSATMFMQILYRVLVWLGCPSCHRSPYALDESTVLPHFISSAACNILHTRAIKLGLPPDMMSNSCFPSDNTLREGQRLLIPIRPCFLVHIAT